jgi:DNA-directed RNA polymerase subunit M/transcription elongation factor TFIIS
VRYTEVICTVDIKWVNHYYKCPECHQWMGPIEVNQTGVVLVLHCEHCGTTLKSVGEPRFSRFSGRDGIIEYRAYPDGDGNICHKRAHAGSINYTMKDGKRVEITSGPESTQSDRLQRKYLGGKQRYSVTVLFFIDAAAGIDPDGICTMFDHGCLEFYDRDGKSIATSDDVVEHNTVSACLIGDEWVFVCADCGDLFATEEAYQKKDGSLICPTCWMTYMKRARNVRR